MALDWTDFDADKQATIMLSLITDHGRATPLVWLTVDKRTLKDNRSLYEHRVLVRLAELLPADIKVCVVADRGFGDQKLPPDADRGTPSSIMSSASAATSPSPQRPVKPMHAAAWVRASGRARMLRGAGSPPITTGWAP